MKILFTLMGLGLSLSLGSVFAAGEPAPAAKTTQQGKVAVSDKRIAQQKKMKNCNKMARDKALKGDPRKAFMKSCLSNKG